MTDILIRLVTALLGTIGFAMIFRIGRNRMPWAALGGLLTYAVYELAIQLGGEALVAAFLASVFMTLYSEALARILRAPAVTFLLPCAIPIVPGGSLYYTVYNLLFYNAEKLFHYAKATLSVALGMAVGMGVAAIIVGVMLQITKVMHKKQ